MKGTADNWHSWRYGHAEPRPAPVADPAHHSVLGEFFARHPSAMNNSRAGGYYRIICDNCGEIVPVAIHEDDPTYIEIHCQACGWEQHLGQRP